ncbi:MAG: hypothetical protein DME15_11800 [Candidatus Rokuibacteriota bacterium]|nr:MAG: hypothetical protein DME15_11800 [Candidatus Rokubacteria bacterium]
MGRTGAISSRSAWRSAIAFMPERISPLRPWARASGATTARSAESVVGLRLRARSPAPCSRTPSRPDGRSRVRPLQATGIEKPAATTAPWTSHSANWNSANSE